MSAMKQHLENLIERAGDAVEDIFTDEPTIEPESLPDIRGYVRSALWSYFCGAETPLALLDSREDLKAEMLECCRNALGAYRVIDLLGASGKLGGYGPCLAKLNAVIAKAEAA